jgi:hypothetical protein
MKTTINISLACLLISCGQSVPYKNITRSIKNDSDHKLALLAQEFIDYCDTKEMRCSEILGDKPRLSINWDSSLDLNSEIAYCKTYWKRPNEISDRVVRIHPKAKEYSENSFRSLLAHELAHCILRYDHTPEDYVGIMRPAALHEYEIESLGGLHAAYDDMFNYHVIFRN